MENYIPENTCRTCLQQSDKLISLYTVHDDTGLTLLEKLRFCVSMQVLVSERTPTNACAPCVRCIVDFCEFKRRCELSEKALEGMCGEPTENAVPKTEVVYMEEDGGGEAKIVAKMEPEESNFSFDDGSDWRDSLGDEEKVDAKRGFKCDGCGELFETESCMQEHYARDHQKLELPCDVEDSGSQNIVNVHDQLEIANSNSEQHGTKGEDHENGVEIKSELKFACEMCGKRFGRKSNLKRHQKMHVGHFCPFCGKYFEIKEEQSIHVQTCSSVKMDKKKAGVPCDECPNTFFNIYNLKQHKQRCHTENGKQQQCNLCGKSFVHAYELRRHMKTHTHRRAHCDGCNKLFDSLPEMLEHRASAHPELEPYVVKAKRDFKCRTCGKLFEFEFRLQDHYARVHQTQESSHDVEDSSSQNDLTVDRESVTSDSKQHEKEKDECDVKDGRTDAKLKFACETCGKRFGWRGNLNRHRLLHIGQYSCPMCCERFKTKTEQLAHVKSCCAEIETDKKLPLKPSDDLTEENKQPCDQCSGSFVNLKLHKMRRHVKRHRCELCGAAFTAGYRLRRHIEHTHKNTRNYVCEMCGKAYGYKKTLLKHIEENHSAEKPVYTCDVCGKTYNILASLQGHRRNHGPDLRLKCVRCERTYPNKFRLAQHVRMVHMKGQACDECDKRFFTRRELLKHKAVHALYASRPHVCKVCDKRFPTASTLSCHMSAQHSKKRMRCNGCGKGYNNVRNIKAHKKKCPGLLKLTQQ